VAEVKPFRALRYDPERVALDQVVAPPYDVIDDDARSRYLARSPYNVVRLTLGEPEEAAAAFRSCRTRACSLGTASRRSGG